MRFLFVAVLLWMISLSSYGQIIISKKTNGIKVDLNSTTNTTLPRIEWVNPLRDDVRAEEHLFTISALITSPDSIKKLVLKWESATFSKPVIKDIEIPPGATTFTLNQPLNLRDGANTIDIIVISGKGGEVKESRTISIGENNNLLDANRKDYALLIATDNYDNWNNLVNPIFDAETIAKKLKDTYGFQVEILKDPPSQDEIVLALRKYSAREFREQDQLFIFFAGHGQYDETLGEGYIVTKGSRRKDLSKTSYLAYASLRQYINNIDCKHIFVAVDACFGGTFDEKLVAKRSAYDSPDDSEWLARKLAITTRRYLTSGGNEYVPDGTPGNHSPFAKRLIEALNSNGNEDQVLTMTELLSYFEKLEIMPRAGGWGDNEPGSDFLFIVAPSDAK